MGVKIGKAGNKEAKRLKNKRPDAERPGLLQDTKGKINKRMRYLKSL